MIELTIPLDAICGRSARVKMIRHGEISTPHIWWARRPCLPEKLTIAEDNDDVLDAALCVVVGVGILRGKVIKPADQELARKEGWIWVRTTVIQGDQP